MTSQKPQPGRPRRLNSRKWLKGVSLFPIIASLFLCLQWPYIQAAREHEANSRKAVLQSAREHRFTRLVAENEFLKTQIVDNLQYLRKDLKGFKLIDAHRPIRVLTEKNGRDWAVVVFKVYPVEELIHVPGLGSSGIEALNEALHTAHEQSAEVVRRSVEISGTERKRRD